MTLSDATLAKLLAYYPKKDYWNAYLARLPRKAGFSPRFELDVLTGLDETLSQVELLDALEEALGIRLLNRTTRSVSPTEAGQRLLDRLVDEAHGVACPRQVGIQERLHRRFIFDHENLSSHLCNRPRKCRDARKTR